MSAFTDRLEYRMDERVRENLKEVNAQLSEEDIKKLVDFNLEQLAEKLLFLVDNMVREDEEELPEVCPKCCALLVERGLARAREELCEGCKPWFDSETAEEGA